VSVGSKLRVLAAGLLILMLIGSVAVITIKGHTERPQAIVSDDASRAEPLIAGMFSPAYRAPDFSLPGTNGSDATLASYRGKVVLLEFGFTNCAAVCPTTLATLAQARKKLGKAADSVQVVFVTVDPERDDVAHLRDYLAAFDPGFVGATGSPAALAAIRQKYGVTAVKEGNGSDYAIAHTASIFMIDRTGKLRALMPYGHQADDFVHDIRYLAAN